MESILEIYDIKTASRETVYEFPYLIEAPNWSMDGNYLVYNSNGRIYSLDLKSKEINEIYTGFATACNNDHVLSADGRSIAIPSP